MQSPTLRAKYTGEIAILPQGGFQFGSMLQPGETISAPDVGVSVYSGTDASPQSMFKSATISGTSVLPVFQGGVAGNIYNVAVQVTTSLGQVIEIDGYLAVISDVVAPPPAPPNYALLPGGGKIILPGGQGITLP